MLLSIYINLLHVCIHAHSVHVLDLLCVYC